MGQLQHLSENYYRVKHYLGSVNGKLKFEYHKQSPQYVQSLLSKPSPIKIDPIDPKTIDPKILKSYPDYQNSQCLGSLAWWGSALVRRGSRVQIPPEAPLLRKRA
jgi:hypothetical protein